MRIGTVIASLFLAAVCSGPANSAVLQLGDNVIEFGASGYCYNKGNCSDWWKTNVFQFDSNLIITAISFSLDELVGIDLLRTISDVRVNGYHSESWKEYFLYSGNIIVPQSERIDLLPELSKVAFLKVIDGGITSDADTFFPYVGPYISHEIAGWDTPSSVVFEYGRYIPWTVTGHYYITTVAAVPLPASSLMLAFAIILMFAFWQVLSHGRQPKILIR